MMTVTRIFAEEWDAETRLAAFGTNQSELRAVVREVVGARADHTEDDPINAPGLMAYILGTRSLRALFRSKGWHIDRGENIESVVSPDRLTKIVFQNVDQAAEVLHNPQALSAKGSGAERAIDRAQGGLFAEADLVAMNNRLAPVTNGVGGHWLFCVSVDGEDVRAELSRASGLGTNGNFKPFHERIFIVGKGQWGDINVAGSDDSGPAEFEPVIRRK